MKRLHPCITGTVAVALVLVSAVAVAGETAPDDTGGKWIGGSFDADIDAVWADGDSDINLGQTLRLRMDPPKRENLHFRASLWAHEDLSNDEGRRSSLRDINDASGSDVRARLLHLYAQFDDLWGDSVLRLGRQRIYEGAAFNRIDGLYFKQHRGRADWYLFAGARATIYGDTHDDLVLGGGASYRTSSRTRFALDAYYGEENRSWRVGRGDDVEDATVSLSAWHTLTPNVRLFARYNWEDAQGDEFLFNVTGFCPRSGIYGEFTYRRQASTVGDRVADRSDFFRILGSHEQYDHFSLALNKALGSKFALSLETELHEAKHDSSYTANRDYERMALILSADELREGLDANLALERWYVHGGEGTWAVTGEVEKTWEKLRMTLGADYERYKDRMTIYDSTFDSLQQIRILLDPTAFRRDNLLVFLFDERVVRIHENIYSVYTKARWTLGDSQDVTAALSWEQDDGPHSPYWRFKMAYSIQF